MRQLKLKSSQVKVWTLALSLPALPFPQILLLCLVVSFHQSLFKWCQVLETKAVPLILAGPFYGWAVVCKRASKYCCDKYTCYISVSSHILLPSIRVVVVHGRMSISHTFALHLHVLSNFVPLWFIFDFSLKYFGGRLPMSVLQPVVFCCAFYDSYTLALFDLCYFEIKYIFHHSMFGLVQFEHIVWTQVWAKWGSGQGMKP